jgi:hypothetical protein
MVRVRWRELIVWWRRVRRWVHVDMGVLWVRVLTHRWVRIMLTVRGIHLRLSTGGLTVRIE